MIVWQIKHTFSPAAESEIDDYAKDGGQGEVWLVCSFYHDLCGLHFVSCKLLSSYSQVRSKLLH